MRFAAVWHRFWFPPRPAEDLAICRILFAAGMFLVGLSRPIHEWGEVPAFYHRPGVFLRRLDIPILDTGVLQGMEFVWLGAMVTLALGWYSRTSAAIVCLGSFYLFGIDAPEFLGRSVTAGVFVPAILAVSYCGDVLSVDAWRRRRRGQVINRPAEEYGWPARLVCVFLSYVFFAAGVAKIRETGFPEWMLSDQTTRSLLARTLLVFIAEPGALAGRSAAAADPRGGWRGTRCDHAVRGTTLSAGALRPRRPLDGGAGHARDPDRDRRDHGAVLPPDHARPRVLGAMVECRPPTSSVSKPRRHEDFF